MELIQTRRRCGGLVALVGGALFAFVLASDISVESLNVGLRISGLEHGILGFALSLLVAWVLIRYSAWSFKRDPRMYKQSFLVFICSVLGTLLFCFANMESYHLTFYVLFIALGAGSLSFLIAQVPERL